ncbi:MAG: ATP-binding cassette domain-containing protein [Neisseriaceae bacterium]|nr:ATP-binding cassette domain-containing protein [Neisseriaceae bacterium]
MIELSNINKTFYVDKRPVQALKDVSINVKKGEIFGIIGYSGAGKSTLVRCVNLLERPDSGSVIVDGQDLTRASKAELNKARHKIGMIFQGYNLLKTATVYDNIAIPLRLEGIAKDEIARRVKKYLDIVGLSDRHDYFPNQLSGGQKQRVAIARALAHEPELLLSDEATSALDPETTESILALLLKINRELNITIFLITHELEVIERICDKVAIMEHGQVIEAGDVLSILAKPKEAVTRRFLRSTAPKLPEELTERLRQTGSLVHLTFIGISSEEPNLALVPERFQVYPNILGGNIAQLKNGLLGQLLVHLKGDQTQVAQAISFLERHGISVEKEQDYV